jgi:hypothetical protein
MCPTNDKSHVEAWKSVIEFAKTVISISSAILTALVGYYVVNQSDLGKSYINYVPPAFLVGAIVIAIFGFGKAIRAISTGNYERNGVLLSNISVALLLAGVLSISMIKVDKRKSLDTVLTNIEKETASLKSKLTPELVQKVVVNDLNYLVTFNSGTECINVTYSEKEHRIIKIE